VEDKVAGRPGPASGDQRLKSVGSGVGEEAGFRDWKAMVHTLELYSCSNKTMLTKFGIKPKNPLVRGRVL
jgi:hypothetical protein